MIISSSLPVKFWTDAAEVYNAKDEPGVDHRKFYQVWLPTDPLILQVTDDEVDVENLTTRDLKLQIKDRYGDILDTVDFTVEAVNGNYVYSIDTTFGAHGISNAIVSLVIVSVQTELQAVLTAPMGTINGEIVNAGLIYEIVAELTAPMGVAAATVVNNNTPDISIANNTYITSDIVIDGIDLETFTLIPNAIVPHHGQFPLDVGESLLGLIVEADTYTFSVLITVTVLYDPHYLEIRDSNGTVHRMNVTSTSTYIIPNVVANNQVSLTVELKQGSI